MCVFEDTKGLLLYRLHSATAKTTVAIRGAWTRGPKDLPTFGFEKVIFSVLAWSSDGLIMASAWLVGLVIMALACSSDGLIIASTWLVGLVTMASLGLDIMASLLGLVTMASVGLVIMAGLMAGWAWLAGL